MSPVVVKIPSTLVGVLGEVTRVSAAFSVTGSVVYLMSPVIAMVPVAVTVTAELS